jgi:hypothetical protein
MGEVEQLWDNHARLGFQQMDPGLRCKDIVAHPCVDHCQRSLPLTPAEQLIVEAKHLDH